MRRVCVRRGVGIGGGARWLGKSSACGGEESFRRVGCSDAQRNPRTQRSGGEPRIPLGQHWRAADWVAAAQAGKRLDAGYICQVRRGERSSGRVDHGGFRVGWKEKKTERK